MNDPCCICIDRNDPTLIEPSGSEQPQLNTVLTIYTFTNLACCKIKIHTSCFFMICLAGYSNCPLCRQQFDVTKILTIDDCINFYNSLDSNDRRHYQQGFDELMYKYDHDQSFFSNLQNRQFIIRVIMRTIRKILRLIYILLLISWMSFVLQFLNRLEQSQRRN